MHNKSSQPTPGTPVHFAAEKRMNALISAEFNGYACMKAKQILLTLFLVTVCLSISVSGDSDIGGLMQKIEKESLDFNKTVTDAEILEYLYFKYEIDPDQLEEVKRLEADSENLNSFMKRYRDSHNNAGVKIPTLRGMTPGELDELREIFKWKKRDYDSMRAADASVKSLSTIELNAILKEGKKLIDQFGALRQNDADYVVKITNDFPESLNFLGLKFINLSERNCGFYLHKGVGAGVGVSVSLEAGEYNLYSFNEYESWDRNKITVPSE